MRSDKNVGVEARGQKIATPRQMINRILVGKSVKVMVQAEAVADILLRM
jgi:hypothetical protein